MQVAIKLCLLFGRQSAGDILNLKWEEVDLETGTIKLLIRKKRVMLEMPLNDQAMKIVKAWHGMRKNQWVFYNPETGHQFKDLWLGLQKACKMRIPAKANTDSGGNANGIPGRRRTVLGA
jgi:integrase